MSTVGNEPIDATKIRVFWEMRAILLAAGFGTRLGSLTKEFPNCLIKVGDKPIIQFWVESLAEFGVTEIIVNTHFESSKVQEFFKHFEKNNVEIHLSHETKLLGTYGTIKKHKKWLSEKGDFFCIHADNYTNLSLNKLYLSHINRPANTVMTMATFETQTPENCGIVQTDKSGKVLSYIEKPQQYCGNLANEFTSSTRAI